MRLEADDPDTSKLDDDLPEMPVSSIDRGRKIDKDCDFNSEPFCIYQQGDDTVEAVDNALRGGAAFAYVTVTHVASGD